MKSIFVILSVLSFILITTASADAAQLFFKVDKNSLSVAQTGKLTLYLDSEKKTVNTVSAIISFDPSIVEVSKVSVDKSIVNLWIQTTAIDAKRGTVTLKGVIFNPGYNGKLGLILGLDFKAIAPGKAQFGVMGFKVLANDGKGTVLATKGNASTVTITGTATNPSGVRITSSTHPDQKKWYTKRTASLSWTSIEKDIVRMAYVFDQNAKTEVSSKAVTKSTSSTKKDLRSGIWYAHVRAEHKTRGWLPTQHFQVRIDADVPAVAKFSIAPRLNESILPVITVTSSDALSGIAAYEIYANGKLLERVKTVNAYKLKGLKQGKNTIEIKIFDNAGNNRTDKLTVLYNSLVKPAPKANPAPKTKPTPKTTPAPVVKPKITAPILLD